MAPRGMTRRSLLGRVAAAGGGVLAGDLLRPAGSFALSGGRSSALRGGGFRGGARGVRGRADALAVLPPALPAGPGQPPIVAREAWAQGRCPPAVAPAYGEVRLAFVHHTENPNGYTPAEVPGMLRAIYAFHRYGRGWNDIGYNFVIDRFGRIFEARAGGVDEAVIGAQAGGYNYASTGIGMLGEFGALRISSPARRALERLLAWKLSLHGAPLQGRTTVRVTAAGAVYSRFPAGDEVLLPRIAGHRDADSTTCPGDALYRELRGVRAQAARLAGQAAALITLAFVPGTEAPPAAEAPPGGEGATGPPAGAPSPTPTGTPPTLHGLLTRLGPGGAPGPPLAGAPVQIQARSLARRGQQVKETTLAQVATAADGSFSVPLVPPPPTTVLPREGLWLRALCPGAPGVPAAVSGAVPVQGLVPAGA